MVLAIKSQVALRGVPNFVLHDAHTSTRKLGSWDKPKQQLKKLHRHCERAKEEKKIFRLNRCMAKNTYDAWLMVYCIS